MNDSILENLKKRKKINITDKIEYLSILNEKGQLDKKLEPDIPDDFLPHFLTYSDRIRMHRMGYGAIWQWQHLLDSCITCLVGACFVTEPQMAEFSCPSQSCVP